MKKIENFIKKGKGKLESLNMVFGGIADEGTSRNSYTQTCGGVCEIVTTTDAFNDSNGNGNWDSGETGASTTTITQCNA